MPACSSPSFRSETRGSLASPIGTVRAPRIQAEFIYGLLLGIVRIRVLGIVRIRGIFALSHASELSLYLGDTDVEAALDLSDCLGLSAEVAGLIEVLQVGAQLIKEFAGKAVTHRLIILTQNMCK